MASSRGHWEMMSYRNPAIFEGARTLPPPMHTKTKQQGVATAQPFCPFTLLSSLHTHVSFSGTASFIFLVASWLLAV